MPYRLIHRDSKHPFEWVFVSFLFLFSIFQALSDIFPGAIDTYLDGAWKYAWGMMMMLGSGLVLLGIKIKKDSTGLSLERVGLTILCGVSFTYAYALGTLGLDTALFAMMFFMAFATSCLLRVRQIKRDIKKVAGDKYEFITIESIETLDTQDRSEEGGDIP